MTRDAVLVPTPESPAEDWQVSLAAFLLGAEADALVAAAPPQPGAATVRRVRSTGSRAAA